MLSWCCFITSSRISIDRSYFRSVGLSTILPATGTGWLCRWAEGNEVENLLFSTCSYTSFVSTEGFFWLRKILLPAVCLLGNYLPASLGLYIRLCLSIRYRQTLTDNLSLESKADGNNHYRVTAQTSPMSHLSTAYWYQRPMGWVLLVDTFCESSLWVILSNSLKKLLVKQKLTKELHPIFWHFALLHKPLVSWKIPVNQNLLLFKTSVSHSVLNVFVSCSLHLSLNFVSNYHFRGY